MFRAFQLVMRCCTLFAIAAALVAVTYAGPIPRSSSSHVQHEIRLSSRGGWKKVARLPTSYKIAVRIGLTQQNLDRADEFIQQVSHPSSPRYGQHWSPEKIIQTFAAKDEAIEAVRAWLETEGISRQRIQLSTGRNWITFKATRAEVEHLLKTEYHLFKNGNGHSHVACDAYHIPKYLREHIDFVTPTVHFDQAVDHGRRSTHREHLSSELRKRILETRVKIPPERVIQAGAETGILGSPDGGNLPKQGQILANSLIDLSMCDTTIIPACLRALYAVPPPTHHRPNNTLGIVEFTPQAYLQSDLNLFFEEFEPRLVGKHPITSFVDNGVLQTENQSFAFNGESALDLEHAMALLYPQQVTLYQVGDREQGASFNNFLEALDGSYCGFDGGRSNDPNLDGQYPDAIACGTAPLVNVISSSYAYNEGDLHPRYERRQCNEYMKLGLQGVSVVFPSGDFGVAGNKRQCFDPLTGAYQSEYDGGIFNPSFPASCPYVTAVGATQVLEGSSVRSGEVAIHKTIRSGGGFSNVFEMPEYQKNALERYWRDFAPPYGQDRHNNSKATRGFPDVSANGANFVTAVNGNFILSFGTSASTPIFASILTLINEERLAAGKSTVGFVNPVLYENPYVLNDIEYGTNPGCSTDGYSAVEGWDPVTGLGTPNYRSMVELFLSLP